MSRLEGLERMDLLIGTVGGGIAVWRSGASAGVAEITGHGAIIDGGNFIVGDCSNLKFRHRSIADINNVLILRNEIVRVVMVGQVW